MTTTGSDGSWVAKHWQELGRFRRRVHSPMSIEETVADVCSFERLRDVALERARKPKKAGPDGIDLNQLTRAEINRICAEASRLIAEKAYQPRQGFAEVHLKPDGSERIITNQNAIDIVVSKTLLNYIQPLTESQWFEWSFGRTGGGVDRMLQQLKIDCEFLNNQHIYEEDVRKAFDNVRLDKLFPMIDRQEIDEDIKNLLKSCLIAGREPESTNLGVPQGNPLSPLALGLILHHSGDEFLEKKRLRVTSLRWMDNYIYCLLYTSDHDSLRRNLEKSLNRVGLTLKQLAPNSTVLGNPFWFEGRRLKFGISVKAWTNLKVALEKCSTKDRPAARATLILESWLSYHRFALAEKRSEADLHQIRKLLKRVNLEKDVNLIEISRTYFGQIRMWNQDCETTRQLRLPALRIRFRRSTSRTQRVLNICSILLFQIDQWRSSKHMIFSFQAPTPRARGPPNFECLNLLRLGFIYDYLRSGADFVMDAYITCRICTN